MSLEPLECPRCGAPVPLLDAERFACPYCRAHVDVPAAYRELFAVHARELAARHELEQRYIAVATPPPRRVDLAAAVLVLLAPAAAASGCVAIAGHPISIVSLFVLAIVPALLPGTALWVWSAAVHATIVRFQLALACDPPAREGGPARCRHCGAPLELAAGAISAHCAYCGTDSLIDHAAEAARRLGTKLRGELRTLADAIAALRVRRRLLVGGVAVATLLLGGLVVALLAALR